MKYVGYAVLHPADSAGYFAPTRKEAQRVRELMIRAIQRVFGKFKYSPSDVRRLRKKIIIRRLMGTGGKGRG